MRVIGVAGGIGTGKSEVARMLGELGAAVLEADKIGHEVYLPYSEGWQDVVATFGDDVLLPTGEVDRRKLGGKVFGNPEAMEKLNAITHPRIRHRLKEGIEEARKAGFKVVVVDAAILIEAGWTGLCNEVWIATAPEAQVIQRVQARNNLSEEQIRARIASQMSTEERVKHANVVVENDGDLEALRHKVKALWEKHLAGRGMA